MEKNKVERIDTTLPKDFKDYISAKGYRYNELIRLGVLAKEGNPQLIARLQKVENAFAKLSVAQDTILTRLEYIMRWIPKPKT